MVISWRNRILRIGTENYAFLVTCGSKSFVDEEPEVRHVYGVAIRISKVFIPLYVLVK